MEEDFLDLGFVDQSILNEFQDIKEEPTESQEEDIEKNDEQLSTEEELSKEEIKDPEQKEVVENPDSKQETGSPNISSSIAEALVDEGVLQTLSKERLNEIKTTEDLIEAFREDLRNQLSEEQKRISDALTYGVEPTRIQQYEQWIKTLDEVPEDAFTESGTDYENYRKNLIYRDYLNKGFDETDATEMVNRSVESGKDIDDAKKALSSLKKYYQKAYADEINEAKKEHDKYVASQKKQFEELKSSVLEDKDNFYEQFEINKSTRQKIFDAITKQSVTDGDKKITPLQAFIKNDPNKANKIIGTLYVLTEGFTKFDGIMKGTVKKQVRESVKNLEKALNQSKPLDGSISFKSGIGEDGSNLKIVDFAI